MTTKREIVSLSEEDSIWATELAQMTHERYKSKAGYYRNLFSSHLLGRYGEIAVFRLLSQDYVSTLSNFANPSLDKDCDILCDTIRIDSKCWNLAYWRDWGRCVAVNQVPALQRKADIVIWSTVDLETQSLPISVFVRGWNTVEEISATNPIWTGPPGRQVLNHQVNEASLRPIKDLWNLIGTSMNGSE